MLISTLANLSETRDVILRGVSLNILCVIRQQLITHIPVEYYEFYEIYAMNVT